MIPSPWHVRQCFCTCCGVLPSYLSLNSTRAHYFDKYIADEIAAKKKMSKCMFYCSKYHAGITVLTRGHSGNKYYIVSYHLELSSPLLLPHN